MSENIQHVWADRPTKTLSPGSTNAHKKVIPRTSLILRKAPIFLLFLAATLLSTATSGQNKSDKIRQIRATCQQINENRALTQKTADEEKLFQGNAPDGGGSLVGYFDHGQLRKMDFTVGLSYGEITKSFYFEDGHLIFVYEKEKDFPVAADSLSLDHDQLQLSYEGRYYYDHQKMIHKITSGKKRIHEDSVPDFLKEAREFASLLDTKLK